MDCTFTLSDIIFIVLEAAILIAVVWEGITGLKDYRLNQEDHKLNKEHFQVTQKLSEHQMSKYRRYKGKRIIKQILDNKEENND